MRRHDRRHDHRHAAPAGSPVLDIGGDIGALVVHLRAVPPGGELEACPSGRPENRFHTGVHLRDLDGGGRAEPVAVYPEVATGDYEILDHELRPVAHVHVEGGEVSVLQLT